MSCFGLRALASSPLRRATSKSRPLRRRTTAFSLDRCTAGGGHLGSFPSVVAPSKDVRRDRLDKYVVANANNEKSSNGDAFAKEEFYEAVIERVTPKKDCGVIDFRLKDGKGSILPIFVGDFESTALHNHLSKRRQVRPMTHEFMTNTLRLLGYEVTRVHVTELVGSTYHARVFYRSSNGKGEEISIDARPSDAVNLAVRFNAPIYVRRRLAETMGMSSDDSRGRGEVDVARICQEEISLHTDPTVLLKLQMQVAIAEEEYAVAAELRDKIDKILASDRTLGLMVALESALTGHRFDEAMQLRDELRSLRLRQEGSEKQGSHG